MRFFGFMVSPNLLFSHRFFLRATSNCATMKAQLSSKNTRLDVYVEDKDGNVADIEMQTTDTKSVINYDERDEKTIIRELPLRTRYYQNIIGTITENIFLNVKAADKADDEELAAFLRYVNGQSATTSFTRMLDKEATRIKNNDDWRLKAMTLDMEIQDMKKRIAKREREKGKQERTLEIAKAMLADGMEISKVAKLTNLSVKEVTALA